MKTSGLRPPRPPFRLVWSFLIPNWHVTNVIVGNTAYLLTYHSLIALDLLTGSVRWEVSVRGFGGQVCHVGGSIFVLAAQAESREDEDQLETLFEYEAETGELKWRARVGFVAPIVGKENLLFTPWSGNTYAALDLTTHETIWETWTDKPGKGSHLVLGEGTVLLSTHKIGIVALDEKTGEKLWRLDDEELLSVCGDVAVTQRKNEVAGRRIANGELLWRHASTVLSDEECIGDSILAHNREGVIRIWTESGEARQVYQEPPAKPYLPFDDKEKRLPGYAFSLDVIGSVFFTKPVSKVLDFDGNLLWEMEEFRTAGGFWTDGEILVMEEHRRLFAYVAGDVDPIPSDSESRFREARELVSKIEIIDPLGLDRLKKLAPESARPLLDLLPGGEERYDRRFSQMIYEAHWSGLLASQEIGYLIEDIVSPEAMPDYIDAYRQVEEQNPSRAFLLNTIASAPDAKFAGPFLVELATTLDPKSQERRIALQGLLNCSYGPGIDLLLKLVHGPDFPVLFPDIVRCGPKGLAEVLKIREARAADAMRHSKVKRRAETDLEKALEAALESQFASTTFGLKGAVVALPAGAEPFTMPDGVDVTFGTYEAIDESGWESSVSLETEFPISSSQQFSSGTLLKILVVIDATIGHLVKVEKFGEHWVAVSNRWAFSTFR